MSRSRGGSIVPAGAPQSGADVPTPLPDTALADPVIPALVEPIVAELLAAELWRRTTARTIGEFRTA